MKNGLQESITAAIIISMTTLMTGPLFADAVVDPATQPIWNIAPLEFTNYDLRINSGASVFQVWHENIAWSGDLREWIIDASGEKSPGKWSARGRYNELVKLAPPSSPYWQQREIITLDGNGTQIPFQWDQLSPAQQSAITANPLEPASPFNGEEIVDFIRGDRSGELPEGIYRSRLHAIGDMLHSTPTHTGAPDDSSVNDATYEPFSNDNSDRGERIFVGANDGMLHVFDADDGTLVYSYLPSVLIAKLNRLAQPGYAHGYYVDGGLSSSDVKVGESWKTLLAGSLGAGGKALFLLDISSAELNSQTVVWEISKHDDIGYIHAAPLIIRLPAGANSEPVVISGNGYLSASNEAKLLLISLQNPAVVTAIPAGSGNRGLSAPAVVTAAGIAYAGDLNGNLWKFDLASLQPPRIPLFSAGSAHPITTRPQVASHPDGGYMIYFGTGSLLSGADGANATPQNVFGIRDKTPAEAVTESTTVKQADLNRTTLSEVTVDDVEGQAVTLRLAETTGTGALSWVASFPPVHASERVVDQTVLRSGRLQFVSAWIDEDGATIKHAFNELNWLDGGAPLVVISDFDNSGALDDGDIYRVDGEDDRYPVGEQLSGYDLFSRPVIASISNGQNAVYLNAINYSCVLNCDQGFAETFAASSEKIAELIKELDDNDCISSTYENAHVTVVTLANRPECKVIENAIAAESVEFDLEKFLFYYEEYKHERGKPPLMGKEAKTDGDDDASSAPYVLTPHHDKKQSEARQSWIDLEQ
jgi:outer membrane protein assembly factor BamB